MRKYLISYWIENNDCATDVEELVIANDLQTALSIFLDKFRPVKRIESIKEMPNDY